MTTCNKGVGSGFNNCVAILTTIVGGIITFDYHGGKGGAAIESPFSNARYAVGDSDGGEGGAIFESPFSNARDAIWDGDRGDGTATTESPISNARYAVGDNRVLTTCNKGVGSGFNNCVAILTTIVGGITTFDCYGSKPRAAIESPFSNARYAIWDGDGDKRRATIKGICSDACYAVRDNDRGEGGTSQESKISNARYAVGNVVVCDGFGDGDGC